LGNGIEVDFFRLMNVKEKGIDIGVLSVVTVVKELSER
jgi:hypothetical protein